MAYIPSECTIQEYENAVYSGEAKHRLYVRHGSTVIGTDGDENASPFASRLTWKRRIFKAGDNTFTLDNFVSQEIELTLHDYEIENLSEELDIKIGTYINDTVGYVYVPLGLYKIQEKPTTNSGKTTYTLRDRSVNFDFNYNGKTLIDNSETEENGVKYVTKLQILHDICSLAGVPYVGSETFLHYDDHIGTFNSNITARKYISYLAEQAGCIATITRSGELNFIPLQLNNFTVKEVPSNLLEKFTNGEKYKISKVVWEAGELNFPEGDDTFDTLYINSANPYIATQEQITDIYNIVNGFEINSFSTGKVLGNPTFDPYDLIQVTYKNITYTTFAQYDLTFNGAMINTFDTTINAESRNTNFSKTSQASFEKSIKSELDLVNATLSTTITQTDFDTNLETQRQEFKEAIDGLSNTITAIGGNNLIKDSMGVLKDGSWSNVESIKDNFTSENATGGSAIMINQTDYNENVFDESNTTLSNLTYDNGTYTQITADTNTYIGWKINAFNNNDFVKMLATKRQAELGEVTMSFTKDSSFNKIAFGLNGADRDTLIFFDVSSLENKQNYELSLDFLNNVQGQISWNNVEIKKENERYRQIVKSKNGTYTISFKYYKTLQASNCKFKINETEYDLLETGTLTNFQETIEVTAGETTIEFSGDTDDSCYILDLMMNEGTGVSNWSQNQDETTTDTVKIGKGIEVISSTTETKAKIDSDGFRVQSTVTQKNVLEATATGIITEELETKGNNNLDGLLIQTINGNHHWISGV